MDYSAYHSQPYPMEHYKVSSNMLVMARKVHYVFCKFFLPSLFVLNCFSKMNSFKWHMSVSVRSHSLFLPLSTHAHLSPISLIHSSIGTHSIEILLLSSTFTMSFTFVVPHSLLMHRCFAFECLSVELTL